MAVNLAIDEAALTGESAAIEKTHAELSEPKLAVGDRAKHGVRRNGRDLRPRPRRRRRDRHVDGVRPDLRLVQTVEAGRTPLQENLDKLGRTLGKAALVVVALIVALGLWRGLPLLDMFIFGIALAVAVVPEALPAVVTISLAIGVRRMVKRNALVRRLPVVETLGSTSVICSDKTGTLTKNEMTVRQAVRGGPDDLGLGRRLRTGRRVPGRRARIRTRPARCWSCCAPASSPPMRDCGARTDGGTIEGDPTEGALVVVAAKAGLDQVVTRSAVPRTAEIPVQLRTAPDDDAARVGRHARSRIRKARPTSSSTACTSG